MLQKGFLLLQESSDHGYRNPETDTHSHTQDPNPCSVAACRLKGTMKKVSGTSRDTPTPILLDTTAIAANEIRAAPGNPEVGDSSITCVYANPSNRLAGCHSILRARCVGTTAVT